MLTRTRLAPGLAMLALLLMAAAPAVGRTWAVSKDGSGDFMVIQLAVDAAASGDTIRIGPGRFDEKQWVTCPGWSDSVRVLVPQEELTIIGSGPETIIGQVDPWDPEQGYHKGIVASDWWGNSTIRVENLHMENMRTALYTSHTTPSIVVVRNCTFYANNNSIWLHSEGGVAQVTDCVFNHMQLNGRHVSGWSQTEFVMRRCTFRLWDVHHWPQGHIYLNGVQDAFIEDCDFYEGAGGAQLSMGSTGSIVDCVFDGQSNTGAFAGPGTTLSLEGCLFRNQTTMTRLYSGDTYLTARNCIVENVQYSSVKVSSVASLSFQNCDLAAGSQGAVWVDDCTQTPPMHLDFTNNYWGTDDPDSIQALIHDRHDSDDVCRYVDFEPYLDESTPVKTKSLSDLKSLFR